MIYAFGYNTPKPKEPEYLRWREDSHISKDEMAAENRRLRAEYNVALERWNNQEEHASNITST